jgi:hypothetical protein
MNEKKSKISDVSNIETKLAKEKKLAKKLAKISREIKELDANIISIPVGFEEMDDVRANIKRFLEKNSTVVQHLIMLIHEGDLTPIDTKD